MTCLAPPKLPLARLAAAAAVLALALAPLYPPGPTAFPPVSTAPAAGPAA